MVTTAEVIGSAPIDIPPTAAGMSVRRADRESLGDQPRPVRVERDLLAVEIVLGLLARGQREIAELERTMTYQGDEDFFVVHDNNLSLEAESHDGRGVQGRPWDGC